jgi:hypothetical protein
MIVSDVLDSVPAAYRDQIVVIDTVSEFVFAGTLVDGDHRYLVLADADVHDLRDSKTNRDEYVLQLRRLGLRANRARVHVSRDQVVSVSLLSDIVE